jgi:hypothetical protein
MLELDQMSEGYTLYFIKKEKKFFDQMTFIGKGMLLLGHTLSKGLKILSHNMSLMGIKRRRI